MASAEPVGVAPVAQTAPPAATRARIESDASNISRQELSDALSSYGSSSRVSDRKQKPKPRCCSFLSRPVPKFQQTLVLLRHSERLDRMDPTYGDSEEGQKWPHDCPITNTGVKLAEDVAEEIAELHKTCQFAVVATSPYRRCVQTAAAVAKRLGLQVVVDQEMGEVWDRSMTPDHVHHRAGVELSQLCKSLGLKPINPDTEGAGLKLFGHPPKCPEALHEAKKRFVIRIENYIQLSTETERNFILVTHADAVAAALEMFEHGFADISQMEFCARLFAHRSVGPEHHVSEESGVYAEQWDVSFKGVTASVHQPPDRKSKAYFEQLHIDECEETEKMAGERKKERTDTDNLFDNAVHKV